MIYGVFQIQHGDRINLDIDIVDNLASSALWRISCEVILRQFREWKVLDFD